MLVNLSGIGVVMGDIRVLNWKDEEEKDGCGSEDDFEDGGAWTIFALGLGRHFLEYASVTIVRQIIFNYTLLTFKFKYETVRLSSESFRSKSVFALLLHRDIKLHSHTKSRDHRCSCHKMLERSSSSFCDIEKFTRGNRPK